MKTIILVLTVFLTACEMQQPGSENQSLSSEVVSENCIPREWKGYTVTCSSEWLLKSGFKNIMCSTGDYDVDQTIASEICAQAGIKCGMVGFVAHVVTEFGAPGDYTKYTTKVGDGYEAMFFGIKGQYANKTVTQCSD